ncbi:VacJ family lipoprotein [Niveispirillum fermenti]|uniref:MlaA family lipoprotein n=1 Tax=Niveispirillum fermenti TaxID=1233113 RepID=UPI003A8AF6A3
MLRPSVDHLLRRTALVTLMTTALATLPVAAQDSMPAGAPPPDAAQAQAPALQVEFEGAEDVNDPLEPMNRAIFWFNEGVDMVLIKPAAQVYSAVLPTPAQKGVRNALRNLRSPLDFANQLLQGDFDGAANVLARFMINSTIGIAGLIDVAGHNGIPYEYESLDQTLAVWGIPEGPYLVLPLLGSSSLRDATGLAGELMADPVTNYASNTDRDWFNYTRAGLTALDTRAEYMDALDDVKRNSFDYYAAMRSLYRQRRDGWIRDGKPAVDQMPEIPDYED